MVHTSRALLVVPDIADTKAAILQELHNYIYAGHVGIHRTKHNVKRIYWWPDTGKHIREYCKVVTCVNTTRICKGGQLAS